MNTSVNENLKDFMDMSYNMSNYCTPDMLMHQDASLVADK